MYSPDKKGYKDTFSKGKKRKKRRKTTRGSRAKKEMGQYKRMKYNSGIMSKLMKMTTSNVFYGVQEVNTLHTGNGKLELSKSLAGNNDQLPLHVIPLNNIRNDDVASDGVLELKYNMYNFRNLVSVDYKGSSPAGVSKVGVQITSAIQRYILCNLMLWASSSKRMRYEVTLVKLLDNELYPRLTESDTRIQQKKILFYGKYLLKHQITSPITENENWTRDIRHKFKVLWKKTYSIDEKLSDRDESFFRLVKIFRKTDKIIKYVENATASNTAVSLDPDVISFPTDGVIPTSEPRPEDNLLLIITANTTQIDSSEKGTYDLSTRVKYTIARGLD